MVFNEDDVAYTSEGYKEDTCDKCCQGTSPEINEEELLYSPESMNEPENRAMIKRKLS